MNDILLSDAFKCFKNKIIVILFVTDGQYNIGPIISYHSQIYESFITLQKSLTILENFKIETEFSSEDSDTLDVSWLSIQFQKWPSFVFGVEFFMWFYGIGLF